MVAARARSLIWIPLLLACGSVTPPPAEECGWTVRYAHRSGESAGGAATVHPELTFAIRNGHTRIDVSETERVVRIDHASPSARVCRGAAGLCTTVSADAALVELTAAEGLRAPDGAADSEPTISMDTSPELVANLRTEGARFESHLRSTHGTTHFVVTVRWISTHDDPNTDAVRRVMTTPLELLGAHRLVSTIHHVVGLPLLFDVSITDERPDSEPARATDVYRAVSVDNPPPAL